MGEKLDGSERRKYVRSNVKLNVNFQIINGVDKTKRTRYINGVTENLSSGGLCIHTNVIQMDGLHVFEGDTDNILRIEIELPSGKAIGVMGEVMWFTSEKTGDYKHRVGIRFTEINMMNKDRLVSYLNALNP